MKTNYDRSVKANLSKDLDTISIPLNLSEVIARGMEKGRSEKNNNFKVVPMQKRKQVPMFYRIAASFVLALLVLTSVSNLSPNFVAAMNRIPVIGEFVNLLVFVDNKADGGTVTDGTNLETIESVVSDDYESLFIHFTENLSIKELTAAYEVTYFTNPSRLTFTISGVRLATMTENFETIKGSPFVEDIYTLITLDDSTVRFNIILDPSVSFEIYDHENPALLEIRLIPNGQTLDTVTDYYSLRTYSYPKGETFAIMEELFFYNADINYSILSDTSGEFVYEFGRYASLEEANEVLSSLPEGANAFIQEVQINALPMNLPVPQVIQPEDTTENEPTLETPISSTEFYVSVDHKDFADSKIMMLTATGFEIYSMDMILESTINYNDATWEKSNGTNSFILTILSGEDTWIVQGVFDDFFEALDTMTK